MLDRNCYFFLLMLRDKSSRIGEDNRIEWDSDEERREKIQAIVLSSSARIISPAPFTPFTPRGSFLQRYLQDGIAGITGNLLRNSDRQSSFRRSREHTNAKVSTESTNAVSLLPTTSSSLVLPFALCLSLLPLVPSRPLAFPRSRISVPSWRDFSRSHSRDFRRHPGRRRREQVSRR